ncbi:MAG: S8 family serine peptidase, partial [Planctomycetota bacterium]|nr:S8 family serine peptidase [Planctomycetota bacterium]
MSTNSKTPRFAALLALLAVLCFALGASDAIAKSKSKSKSTVEDAAVLTFDKSTRDGGIDPTTVPIIDEDMQFMVQVTRAQIGADAAHTITRGEGMVVAVLDSGFNLDHPALAGRLMGRGYDAIDDDFDAHDTGNGFDDNFDGLIDSGVGHGTFVAGMVLLAAPDAMILPIRVRDDEGYGTNAETIRGLKFAKSIGVDVINLSLSS